MVGYEFENDTNNLKIILREKMAIQLLWSLHLHEICKFSTLEFYHIICKYWKFDTMDFMKYVNIVISFF